MLHNNEYHDAYRRNWLVKPIDWKPVGPRAAPPPCGEAALFLALPMLSMRIVEKLHRHATKDLAGSSSELKASVEPPLWTGQPEQEAPPKR